MTPENILNKLKKDLELWIASNEKDQTVSGIHGTYTLKANPDIALAWKLVLKLIERLEERE
jgi:hypothetical protein